MKRARLALLLLSLCLLLLYFRAAPAATAGVPHAWTVDVGRDPAAENVAAMRGETVDLACTLVSGGAPIDLSGCTAAIYWQTNGMAADSWWSAPASATGGVLSARWTPAMDPGASPVSAFLGARDTRTGDLMYRAILRIRVLPAPGAAPASPAALPDPGRQVLDFAALEVLNAPWRLLSESVAAEGALWAGVRAAAEAATNYADGAAAAAARRTDAAALAATNYTDAAVAAIEFPAEADPVALAALAAAAAAATNYADEAVAAIEFPAEADPVASAWLDANTNAQGRVAVAGALADWSGQAVDYVELGRRIAEEVSEGVARATDYTDEAVAAIEFPAEADPVASAWLDANTNALGIVSGAVQARYAVEAGKADSLFGSGRTASSEEVFAAMAAAVAAGPAATNYADSAIAAALASFAPAGVVAETDPLFRAWTNGPSRVAFAGVADQAGYATRAALAQEAGSVTGIGGASAIAGAIDSARVRAESAAQSMADALAADLAAAAAAATNYAAAAVAAIEIPAESDPVALAAVLAAADAATNYTDAAVAAIEFPSLLDDATFAAFTNALVSEEFVVGRADTARYAGEAGYASNASSADFAQSANGAASAGTATSLGGVYTATDITSMRDTLSGRIDAAESLARTLALAATNHTAAAALAATNYTDAAALAATNYTDAAALAATNYTDAAALAATNYAAAAVAAATNHVGAALAAYVATNHEGGVSIEGAFAHGHLARAIGPWSHAEGEGSAAFRQASHAEGLETVASNRYAHAEGSGTLARGLYSHAEGEFSKALGQSAHAEGQDTVASNNYSHAEGGGALARGLYSHAEGRNTEARKDTSHAEGSGTLADGYFSHAEGLGTTTLGDAAHAEGEQTTARGKNSHAEGYGTAAYADGAHAEGEETAAKGLYSHSEGEDTIAWGYASHAEGYATTASNTYSHAEGYGTTASGMSSHAEGFATTASGENSHASGSWTTASGLNSFAAGNESVASGNASIALGVNATASHAGSFVWVGDRTNTYSGAWTRLGGASAGDGTFNVHPVGGSHGFFIGGERLDHIIGDAVDAAAIEAIDAAEDIVRYAHDGNDSPTALSIGGNNTNGAPYSVALGKDIHIENQALYSVGAGSDIYIGQSAPYSLALGSHVAANDSFATAAGVGAYARDSRSYVWGGSWSPGWSIVGDYYRSHGAGTYNVNPAGGAAGFYIGETNLAQTIANLAPPPDLTGYATEPYVTNYYALSSLGRILVTTNDYLYVEKRDAATNAWETAWSSYAMQTNFARVAGRMDALEAGYRATTNAAALSGSNWADYDAQGHANPTTDTILMNRAYAAVGSGFFWASSGGYYCLASSGTVAYSAVGEGSWRLFSSSVSNYVGIVSGEQITVGCDASGFTVANGTASITYPYSGGDPPVVYGSPSCVGPWTEMSSPVWVYDNNNNTATVSFPADQAHFFFKATTTATLAEYWRAVMPTYLEGGVKTSAGDQTPVIYDSKVEISVNGHTYRIPAQLVN